MRCYKLIRSSAHRTMVAAIKHRAAAMGRSSGFIDEPRRAATPHIVDCIGLNDEDLPYGEYATQLREREDWCRRRCPTQHEIEPLRDRGRLIGRRYRFARESDAVLFKTYFY
jgi:hypothetical protein